MDTLAASTTPDYHTGASMGITDNAAFKLRDLIAEEGNPALMLRVYIHGGGCSGFQYGFTFDDERETEDFAVQRHGVTLVCDPLSLQYLTGAQIDYTENFGGSQFTIHNPNVKTTCGCGSSADA